MHFNGAAFANSIHVFVRLALHIDLADVATQKMSQMGFDFFFHWTNFGTLANHGGVEVAHFKFFLAH